MNIYERVKAVQAKAQEEGHTCEVLLTPSGLRDLLYFGVLSAEAKLAPPNTFFGMPCRLVHEVPTYNPGLEPIGNGIYIQCKDKPVFPPYQVSPEELREMDKVNVNLAIAPTLSDSIVLCISNVSGKLVHKIVLPAIVLEDFWDNLPPKGVTHSARMKTTGGSSHG